MRGRWPIGGALVWLAAVLMVACEPIAVPPADQRAVEAQRVMRAASTESPVIVDDVIAYEGAGRAVVPVRLREASDTLTRLRYSTRSGTAVHFDPQGTEAERTGPFDFHRITDGQLPMQAGLVESQFVIPIRNDNLVEGDETFTVVVEPRCYSWETCPGWQVEATVTIKDGYDPNPPAGETAAPNDGGIPGAFGPGDGADEPVAPPGGLMSYDQCIAAWGGGASDGEEGSVCGCGCNPDGCTFTTLQWRKDKTVWITDPVSGSRVLVTRSVPCSEGTSGCRLVCAV